MLCSMLLERFTQVNVKNVGREAVIRGAVIPEPLPPQDAMVLLATILNTGKKSSQHQMLVLGIASLSFVFHHLTDVQECSSDRLVQLTGCVYDHG